jgi:hypothetical protein
MTTKLKPLDVAKYFPDEASRLDVLDDAAATGHAGYLAAALDIAAWARAHGEESQTPQT